MKMNILYVLTMIAAVITAPIVAFLIALVTFFNCFLGYIMGIHDGFNRLKEEEDTPLEDQTDIWDRHIKRMQNKSNTNNAE